MRLRGSMVERLAADFRLAPVERARPIGSQFPLACDLTAGLFGLQSTKIVLHSSTMTYKYNMNKTVR